ncbi:9613_t:CDS:2 [Ambispora leptoticha]|uniref:9613_t:CDS:1 n=1 Tax=Ambispora leptoticha TaxID=144679 RepID=A0A9N9FI56_9GLOM|nr:9613_t:CDS:2 [Ambispora leptoticha]
MHTVSLHESFKRLNEYCLKTISEQPHIIFEASDFLSLEESVLVSMLKCDDLAMDEIEIWNSIIKWGKGNTLNLPKRPVMEWKSEDFAALKKTLHHWRGSPIKRDVNRSVYLLNSNNYSYLNAPDAFIFSFDKNDVKSAKISRNNSRNQIAYNPYQAQTGPYFYNDLFISSNCDQNQSSWYQYSYYNTQDLWDENSLGLRHAFKVEEYEVIFVMSYTNTNDEKK